MASMNVVIHTRYTASLKHRVQLPVYSPNPPDYLYVFMYYSPEAMVVIQVLLPAVVHNYHTCVYTCQVTRPDMGVSPSYTAYLEIKATIILFTWHYVIS